MGGGASKRKKSGPVEGRSSGAFLESLENKKHQTPNKGKPGSAQVEATHNQNAFLGHERASVSNMRKSQNASARAYSVTKRDLQLEEVDFADDGQLDPIGQQPLWSVGYTPAPAKSELTSHNTRILFLCLFERYQFMLNLLVHRFMLSLPPALFQQKACVCLF